MDENVEPRAGTITALTAQVRNKDRVNVFINGEFAFGLALNAAVPLRIGQELSVTDILALQKQDEIEKAKQLAYNFIGYRPRSEAEVRRHLKKKAYEPLVIEQVIDQLHRLNLLDDAGFARYWIDQRDSFKPRSNYALRQELAQKGIQKEIVDEALEFHDDVDTATIAAGKRAHRWAGLPREAFFEKMTRYLRGRGYTYATTQEVVSETWDSLERDDDD